MPFLAICHDHPGPKSKTIREAKLQEHFAYIETILDRVLVAGPVSDSRPDEFGISLFIYDAEDRDDAEQLLQGDPYFKAGLYGEVQISPFLPAAGRWIGGTVW
ncbi:MAG: YciI family protein [Gammaproteobacteria bacterium]|jgi:hypothetical protein|nr:hypothetical protein [Chromatiales bacterium]MDP6673882.1 YciI family protein [Gammaproteobacteria bacterium]